jgi:segregation and condensation protein A
VPAVKTTFTTLPQGHLHLQGFDGPLELLLHLIGEGELEITAISIAAVSDQYLQIVRLLPADPQRLDFLAEFLVLAAQLLVMKSRALLPREAARADEVEIVDEATLEARLQEYLRFRQAAGQLQERQTQGARAFSRTAPPPLPAPAPPPKLERAAPEQLAAALQRLLASRAPAKDSGPDAPPRVTIGERIAQIRNALSERGKVSFLWLAEDCETRSDLIVTFLAVLELFRGHQIEIQQDELFGEIWIAAA